MCQRFGLRFSSREEAEHKIEAFKHAYEKIQRISVVTSKTPKNLRGARSTSWIVLPYRHEWLCLSRDIGDSQLPQDISDVLGLQRISFAWSLASQHLIHRVRK